MNRGNNPPCFCVLRASASIFKSPNSNANSMRMQMFSGSAVSDASNFYAFLLLSSPRWTSAHTHIHTLAGSAEGCKRGCLEEVPTDATASHIQIIHLVFFFFLLPSLSLLRDPPTPSAGILLWAGSLSQHSNAPVCSCIFILSDLLPFWMDQVQVKRCAASLIRTELMQNKVHGHAQDHLNTMNLYDILVCTLRLIRVSSMTSDVKLL